MTKQELTAKLEVIQNLFDQAIKLSDAVIMEIGDNDKVTDAVRLLEERYPVESVLEELGDTGILQSMPDGKKTSYPLIQYKNPQDTSDVEIAAVLPDGDSLCLYTGSLFGDVKDQPTIQAGIVYFTEDKDPFDICMAEIKKGKIAEMDGLLQDNRDISVMTWADPFSEDYTSKDTVKYDDIQAALEPDKEMDE